MHAWEARKAYREYQAAAASGNPIWTRLALMRLVNLDEDVPDYWIELGKLDLQLGDYRKAFDDFSRAHELDRTNVPDPTSDENLERLHGRGILLMEAYMHNIEWSNKGRRVRMVRRNEAPPAVDNRGSAA